MIIGLSGKKQSGKDLATSMIQFLTLKEVGRKTYEAFQADYEYGDGYTIDRFTTWKNKKFADKLKDICSLLTGIPREYFEQEEYKNKTVSELTGQNWGCYKVYDATTMSYSLYRYENDAIKAYDSSADINNNSNIEYFEITLRQLLQFVGTDCFRDIIHPDVWVLSTMADYKQPVLGHDIEDGIKYEVKGDYPDWIISDVRFPNEVHAIKDRRGIVIRIEREGLVSTDNHISETALDEYESFDYLVNNTTMEEFYYNLKSVLHKQGLL